MTQLRVVRIGAAIATGLLAAVAALRPAAGPPPTAAVIVVPSATDPRDATVRSVPRSPVVAVGDDPAAPLRAGSSDLEQAHDELRRQGRDAAWTARIEPRLVELLRNQAEVTGVVVACARTLCEVTGSIGGGTRSTGPATSPLAALRPAAARLGLAVGASGIGAGTDGQRRFVGYFHRTGA